MDIANGERVVETRDCDFDEHIQAVEKAAADWDMRTDALEGRFVSALLTAIAASGRANRATLSQVERVIEKTRATGEGELRRINVLIKGGEQTLDMARQAAVTAAAAGQRAEREFDASVSRIAKALSMKLLAESQKWLVLKQTARNRSDARRLAFWVAVTALTLFIGG
jgi:hypothetical protein